MIVENWKFMSSVITKFGTTYVGTVMLIICNFVNVNSQQTPNATANDDEPPGILVVIFSPEISPSRQQLAENAVWNSFISKLKKKNRNLGVINEVAVNPSADRSRALEIAGEQSKVTVWLEFKTVNSSKDDGRRNTVEPERILARYTIFAPESNDIISQGEIEQERIPESRFSAPNNEKVFRDNSGRVVNSRSNARLPDGTMNNGPQMLDIDALKRVGELVVDRVVSAVKAFEKKNKS